MNEDERWPPVSDFISMLQNPSVGFADDELKNCDIERDSNRQPRPRAGNFAVCYKAFIRSTKAHVCIRLFARKSNERRERYAQISSYLLANPLNCLARFEYIEKGIRHPNPSKVGNKAWFPIIRMEWIEGRILFDWLRDRCNANDATAISKAADRWVDVAGELQSAGIAHGDLQHANIMVLPDGQLKLIDFDCMCVPSLVGLPNFELGFEPYQHPERNVDTLLFPGLDHFSELFILVGLRALAADPTLWFRYIEPQNGPPYDKLLLRKEDLHAPEGSTVIKELRHSSDPAVRRLVQLLLQFVQLPLAQVPPLSTFSLIRSERSSPTSAQFASFDAREAAAPFKPTESQTKTNSVVFISAKNEDFSHARVVYDFLTKNGVACFFSEESLPALGNSDYRLEIDRALDLSKHMVVVTSNSRNVTSPWVQAEWGFFVNEKRSGTKSGNIVTVITDDIRPKDLPPSLRYYEVLPLTQNSLEKLIRYVRE